MFFIIHAEKTITKITSKMYIYIYIYVLKYQLAMLKSSNKIHGF